jgi:hypothetical protein
MKRKITLSIALALSIVLVSLTSSDSTVNAQQQGRFFAYDSGIIALGPNQVLRIGVVNYRETDFNFRFRQMEYMQTACNGGVCKLVASSQTTTNPITLMPGEAASLELVASTYGRGIVLSRRRDLRVTAQIIDTVTGETISTSFLDTMEEDEDGL